MSRFSGPGQPIAKAGAEAMQAGVQLSPRHQAVHGRVASHAVAEAGKWGAIAGEGLGLVRDDQRLGSKGSAEVRGGIAAALHPVAWDGPDIAFDQARWGMEPSDRPA